MSQFPPRRPLAALAICGVAVLAASGCGSDTIKQSDEQANAKKFLASGALPDLPPVKSVSCPSGVNANVGTTFACTATLSDGQVVTLPYIIKSKGSKKAAWEINQKLIINALAADVIYKTAPTPPKTIACPTDMPAQTGKSFTCKATAPNGTKVIVTLHVDNANPQHLSFVHVSQA